MAVVAEYDISEIELACERYHREVMSKNPSRLWEEVITTRVAEAYKKVSTRWRDRRCKVNTQNPDYRLMKHYVLKVPEYGGMPMFMLRSDELFLLKEIEIISNEEHKLLLLDSLYSGVYGYLSDLLATYPNKILLSGKSLKWMKEWGTE